MAHRLKVFLKKILPPPALKIARKLYKRKRASQLDKGSFVPRPKPKLAYSFSNKRIVSCIAQITDAEENLETPVIYLPWLRGQTPSIVNSLRSDPLFNNIKFIPIIIPTEQPTKKQIQSLKDYVRRNPDEFFEKCLAFLTHINTDRLILLFSQDWYFVQRILLLAAKKSKVKTLLIPHEGVWFFHEKYYSDLKYLANKPGCDLCLAWNDNHKSIFCSRGVPKKRVQVSGSALHYSTELIDPLLRNVKQLNVQFVCQPMDMQVDKIKAISAQHQTIFALAHSLKKRRIIFSVRLPIHRVLSKQDVLKLKEMGVSIYDYDAPRDVWFGKANIIVSHNSTALLEAALAGNLPISVKNFDFEPMFKDFRSVMCNSAAETVQKIQQLIDIFNDEGWAGTAKSMHLNDIQVFAENYVNISKKQEAANAISELASGRLSIWNKGGSDFGIIHKSLEENYFSNLPVLLNQKLVSINRLSKTDKYLTGQHFIWGSLVTPDKINVAKLSHKKRQELFCLEDHPIQARYSFDEPCRAIIITENFPYFDVKCDLTSTFSPDGSSSISDIKKMIITKGISKYNFNTTTSCLPEKSYNDDILFLDQRFGDHSLTYGNVNADTYNKLLNVLRSHMKAGKNVYVKQHPDGKRGYETIYTKWLVPSGIMEHKNIIVSPNEISIQECLNKFEHFVVLTSGVGFEALLRGKHLEVLGKPFYKKIGKLLPNGQSLDNLCNAIFFEYGRFSYQGELVDATKFYENIN